MGSWHLGKLFYLIVVEVVLVALVMYFDKLSQLVESLDGIASADVSPCNENEVSQLEAEMMLFFPASYREFLLLCGKRLGKVIWDDRFYYPFQPSMKEEALGMLTHYGFDTSIIADMGIVIQTHEGYAYHFIRVDEGDDPPVHLVMNDGVVHLESERFSTYFYNQAIKYFRYYGLIV
jgi:hypothetical protein